MYLTAYSSLGIFGLSRGPSYPPNVTHIVDARYRVDISNAVPNLQVNLSGIIGYSTVVLMVASENKTRYYVLVSIALVYL